MTEEDWLTHLENNEGNKEEALKFADWLEENGKPAHAELIRLHCNPETYLYRDFLGESPSHSAGKHVRKKYGTYAMPLIGNFGPDNSVVVRRFHTPHSYKLSRIVFGAVIHPEAAKHLTAALEEEIKDNLE